jgi:hypothetical protein
MEWTRAISFSASKWIAGPAIKLVVDFEFEEVSLIPPGTPDPYTPPWK